MLMTGSLPDASLVRLSAESVVLLSLAYTAAYAVTASPTTRSQYCLTNTSQAPLALSEKYADAFQTFYDYLDRLIENKVDIDQMGSLFSAPFPVTTINNPTFLLETVEDVLGFYNTVRNKVYPGTSFPEEFLYLRVNRLAFTPLSETTLMIANHYVWYTGPSETPRFVEGFLYYVRFDGAKWRMSGLIEVHADQFPTNWIPVQIERKWQYNGSQPISELKVLVAPVFPK